MSRSQQPNVAAQQWLIEPQSEDRELQTSRHIALSRVGAGGGGIHNERASADCEDVTVTVTSQVRCRCEGTLSMQQLVRAIEEEQKWTDGLTLPEGAQRFGVQTPLLLPASSNEFLGDGTQAPPWPVHVAISMGGSKVELPLAPEDECAELVSAEDMSSALVLQLLRTIKSRQEQQWRSLQSRTPHAKGAKGPKKQWCSAPPSPPC